MGNYTLQQQQYLAQMRMAGNRGYGGMGAGSSQMTPAAMTSLVPEAEQVARAIYAAVSETYIIKVKCTENTWNNNICAWGAQNL